MSEIEPQLLRLRASTKQLLRDELEHSTHRSLSALADEILETTLLTRRDLRDFVAGKPDGQR